MHIEILNTGAELLVGRTLNTHAHWMSAQLANHGYSIARHTAVDDSATSIQSAVQEAASRAQLVITTGGLGPTCDDRTRHLIADWAKLPLEEDRAVVAHIEAFFAKRNRSMPDNTRNQALVPAGARVIENHYGTAPGLLIHLTSEQTGSDECNLIMLPGPPRELKPMFSNQIVPLIRELHPETSEYICRTLKMTGIGESALEESITPEIEPLTKKGLETAFCARPGELDLRLATRNQTGNDLIKEAESIVRARMDKHIFSDQDELMEEVVVNLLMKRNETVATAESCTGGLISNRITNVPGASAVFLAGLVTYSNEAKQTFLGVSPETLEKHGAVSKETAIEMARGAQKRSGATYALSVTGIAGPSGGTADKPVGTVFIGFATRTSAKALGFLNPHDRHTFKEITSQQALNILRRHLTKGKPEQDQKK